MGTNVDESGFGHKKSSHNAFVNAQQRHRWETLLTTLQDGTSQRDFAARIGVPPGTIATWKKAVGTKSKLAIVRFVSEGWGPRDLDDLDAYLDGDLSLPDFLDPQYKLHEALARFNLATVRAWIKNRANLDEKLTLLHDLTQQVGGIARANSSLRLSQSIQALLDSGDPKFTNLHSIARVTGINVKRLVLLYKGEAMPCEDEVLALSPYLPEDIEELRRVYVTGQTEA